MMLGPHSVSVYSSVKCDVFASAGMRVCILAGGRGTRLFEETRYRPKPMVEIGGEPILWHIMMHFHAAGFSDFTIALGYKGDVIRRWAVSRAAAPAGACASFDTVGREAHGGSGVEWDIDLLETGLDTETGGRVRALERSVGRQPFLLTWGDGVSDVDVGSLVRFHRSHGRIGTMVLVKPAPRFGRVRLDGLRIVQFSEKRREDEDWINGGIFMFDPGVFDYIDGPDTVFEREPLERLAHDGQLMAFKHPGFWQCMDTLAEREALEGLWRKGNAPWATWEEAACESSSPGIVAM